METWWENQRISSFPRLSASLGNSLTSGDMGALDSRKSQGPLGIKISSYLKIFKREESLNCGKKCFKRYSVFIDFYLNLTLRHKKSSSRWASR